MAEKVRPVVLLILDGWGYSEVPEHNAIHAARTPVWDRLWEQCPHTLIKTSGSAVGLPSGQMGNSEVGHLNLGAGPIVHPAKDPIIGLDVWGRGDPIFRPGLEARLAAPFVPRFGHGLGRRLDR